MSYAFASMPKVTPPEPPAYLRRLLLSNEDGLVLRNRPYRLKLTGGRIVEGTTDDDGLTEAINATQQEIVLATILKRHDGLES